MSLAARKPLPKTNAKTAAAHPNCTAADHSRNSATTVPIQRRAPSHLPTQNVNSAALRELPARHFGGLNAICAIFATI